MLTTDQVAGLAPDGSALAAARKLAGSGAWSSLGRSPQALWGECQGSALYQVRVELTSFSAKCSCPSHKLPCKHSLALMWLFAERAARVPEAEPPAWVAEWLDKRAQASEKREKKQEAREEKPADTAAQAKRAAQRAGRVRAGLDALDLWLADVVRNGLATLQAAGPRAFEEQAARLVDAQAPALAARLRRASELPASSSSSGDWPARLLGELGRIALLSHAFRRIDALSPPSLQQDVRALLGWTVEQKEIAARGEAARDEWLVLGQLVEEEDRLHVQRSWLQGVTSGRSALVLQFSVAGAPFQEVLVPGTAFEATLAFWPGALPLRALLRERHGAARAWCGAFPGAGSVAAHLERTADMLARQPWLDRFPCGLAQAVPVRQRDERWFVVDEAGDALALRGTSHWKLLALSGGSPIGVAGEWDGETLLPLGAATEDGFEPLGGLA